MFPLGHLGLTAALGEALARRGWLPRPLDYRVLLVGALLPDLVDKPLALVFGIDGRNVAHSLLVASGLTALLLLPLRAPRRDPRRGARRPANPRPLLTVGLWTHLLLDRMWLTTFALFWPFKGVGFPPGSLELPGLLAALAEPYVLGGEVAGAAILAALLVRFRLYRRPNLRRALSTGRLQG